MSDLADQRTLFQRLIARGEEVTEALHELLEAGVKLLTAFALLDHRRQRVAGEVLADHDEVLGDLHDLLEHRQDLLDALDLRVRDEDVGLLQHGLRQHRCLIACAIACLGAQAVQPAPAVRQSSRLVEG